MQNSQRPIVATPNSVEETIVELGSLSPGDCFVWRYGNDVVCYVESDWCPNDLVPWNLLGRKTAEGEKCIYADANSMVHRIRRVLES